MHIDNLKNYRYQREWTQAYVGEKLKVTKQCISNWEKKNDVPEKFYNKICELYEIGEVK